MTLWRADRGRSFVAFWLFGDLHHDLHRVAAHERGLLLEVTVKTTMSITNPAQLVAEQVSDRPPGRL